MLDQLCKDNIICCDDNCKRCANLIYLKYVEQKDQIEELKSKRNEVVMCIDCAIPHNKWTGCPKLNGLVTPPDFYCAYGKRKQ